MFDFDEIEEEVAQKGEAFMKEDDKPGKSTDAPKEEPKPSSGGGGGGGMFDFDDIEDNVQKKGADFMKEDKGGGASGGKVTKVCVRFFYKGQSWTRNYEVTAGSTMLELKKKIAEGGNIEEDIACFQLLRSGQVVQDSEELKGSAARVDFSYRPPAAAPSQSQKRPAQDAVSEKKPARSGKPLEVTVALVPSLGVTTVLATSEGTTVRQLKEQMAKMDPTGNTKVEDFELKLEGSSRPLGGDEFITSRTTWLALCERMSGA